MQQQDKQAGDPAEKKGTSGNAQPLSETIADAHAAGDGALERGKDTLHAADDGAAEETKKPTGGENY